MSDKKRQPLGKRIKSSLQQSIFTWLGIPLEMTEGNAWQSWYAQSTSTGQQITVQSSLQLSAVWACVRLIAGTISTLPLGIYERRPDGSKIARPLHPVHALISRSPNRDMTATQFWEAVVAAILMWGDGFAEIQRIGNRGVALNFLLPQRMARRRLLDGSIHYMYTDFDGVQRQILESNLLRIPGFSADGINGLSVVKYAANVFGSAQAAAEASGMVFQNGMRPTGVLQMDNFMTPKQREDARTNIVSQFSGSLNQGKTLVLEGGMKFQGLTIPPEDAQLLQTRMFSIEEVCRWFNVPPFMVAHSEKHTSWGTGIEAQMIGFLTFSLNPWLVRIKQAIGRSLLSPVEQLTLFADFDTTLLTATDSISKAQYYASLAQNGIYTRNELRKRENLPDHPGGDDLTVQTNLTPIAKLGQTPAAPTGADGTALAQPASTNPPAPVPPAGDTFGGVPF